MTVTAGSRGTHALAEPQEVRRPGPCSPPRRPYFLTFCILDARASAARTSQRQQTLPVSTPWICKEPARSPHPRPPPYQILTHRVDTPSHPNSPQGQRRTRGDPRWSPEPAKSIQTTRPEARSVVFPANAPPRLGATCWRGPRSSRVAPHGTSCRASCSRRSVRTDAVLTTTVSV